ncbi:putative transposase-associated domain-containing protein [Tanacetum coccineum]
MDKSWMGTNRTNRSFIDGVAAFIDYVVHNLQKMRNIDPRGNKQHLLMPCPCTKCLNHIEHKVEEVQFHLFRNGIDLSYTKWNKHGEKDEPSISTPKPVNATTEFVDDMDFASDIPTDGPTTVEMVNATKDNFDEDDLIKFQELLLDADKPLYEGCPDFTKLSAIVKLLNLKGKYGCSDKFFTELLGLLKKMLPAGNEMVEKTYQAKKVMKLMGSGYKKIHVCINNCLLYWKDDKDLTACQTCGISRWNVDNKTHKVYENIPAKVMWIIDGVLRHLADSQTWRTIDEKFSEIAKDPRNLRLGISADGVDVNTGNRHHSVWPVLTVIYNLPPWLCIKRKFNMLSVLISGYPGNDIDVFLEPLVDDLHTLFETGVDTYDASIKDNFNLRAIVLWTINDYPALGTLCGCPYSGFKDDIYHITHPFRKQKKAFNGQQEFLLASNPMTEEQIYNEVQHIENKWGKGKQTNNKASKNQEDARGRGGEIQKQKRNTTEEEGSSSQVNGQNEKKVAERVKLELFAMKEEDKTTLPPAGHVRNRNKPEGCIAEETIAEETIEFFSEYHKTMETIGIPTDKHETDENKEGKTLSAGKSSEVSAELFQKAHLYVIHNTDELVPYIEFGNTAYLHISVAFIQMLKALMSVATLIIAVLCGIDKHRSFEASVNSSPPAKEGFIFKPNYKLILHSSMQLTVNWIAKMTLRLSSSAISLETELTKVREKLVHLPSSTEEIIKSLVLDGIIKRLFRRFLKVAEFLSANSSGVVSKIEKIMTMVIKESKELPLELVNLPAINGKIKNEIASPVRIQLAKKVLKSYADQLNLDNPEPNMTVNPESIKKTLTIVDTPSKSVTTVNGKRKRQVCRLLAIEEEEVVARVGELLEGLIPYSQRHYIRIDIFERSTFLVDYIPNGMSIIEPVMGDVDDPKNESLVDPIEVVIKCRLLCERCVQGYGSFTVVETKSGADLTGKMILALAATSILFKDDNSYHKKLLKLQYGFEGKECLEKCYHE